MHELTMEQLWSTSQLAGGNVAYIEELFETYLRDPNEVPEEYKYNNKKLSNLCNRQRHHSEINAIHVRIDVPLATVTKKDVLRR